MLGFIPMPSAVNMIASSSIFAWGSYGVTPQTSTTFYFGFFTTLLELIWLPIGIVVVVSVILLIRRSIGRGVRGVTRNKKISWNEMNKMNKLSNNPKPRSKKLRRTINHFRKLNNVPLIDWDKSF